MKFKTIFPHLCIELKVQLGGTGREGGVGLVGVALGQPQPGFPATPARGQVGQPEQKIIFIITNMGSSVQHLNSPNHCGPARSQVGQPQLTDGDPDGGMMGVNWFT